MKTGNHYEEANVQIFKLEETKTLPSIRFSATRIRNYNHASKQKMSYILLLIVTS
jgi:hypothetical protein